MYENWDKEELIRECRHLRNENEELRMRNNELENDNSSLKFRVENELEPRIQNERQAYDRWVTGIPY